MKKALLLLFVTASFYLPAKAQDFVTYTGNTEKTLINSAQTPDELFKLALASSYNDDEVPIIYEKFNDDLKQLSLESATDDKSPKHLKKVYQLVYNFFLKTYNPHAHFGDFITTGDYDCVGASILYAYVLGKLKIPYQIKQLPAHVYVIADPGSGNVQFETIDQAKGFYVFDDQAKQNNVNALVKAGYVDQSYAANAGTERVFDEFFYSKEDISLKDAVGLLYFDKGMEEVRSDKAEEAYSDISKSDILFPDKKNEFMENDMMLSMVNNFKYDDLKDWRALTQLVNSKSGTDQMKKYLQGQFDNFMNDKLLNSGQKDKVVQVYNYLDANLADTAVKKLIAIDYYFENAHYSYITNDYTQSLNYLEKAYPLNPGNPLVTSDFVQMILHKYQSMAPTAQNFGLFNKYMETYPLLKGNRVIVSIDLYYLSLLSITGFVSGDGAAGEKYMQLLTNGLDAFPDHDNTNHALIAKVFASASIYYFRKQQKQKAIAILNTGLRYEPNDDELQRKLKVDSQ